MIGPTLAPRGSTSTESHSHPLPQPPAKVSPQLRLPRQRVHPQESTRRYPCPLVPLPLPAQWSRCNACDEAHADHEGLCESGRPHATWSAVSPPGNVAVGSQSAAAKCRALPSTSPASTASSSCRQLRGGSATSSIRPQRAARGGFARQGPAGRFTHRQVPRRRRVAPAASGSGVQGRAGRELEIARLVSRRPPGVPHGWLHVR
jgi:hypothetical protein